MSTQSAPSVRFDSPEGQRVCQQLVDREVYYCASELVSRLAELEPDSDEIHDLMTAYDWDESVWQYIRECDDDDLATLAEDYGVSLDGPNADRKGQAIFDAIQETDGLEKFCEDHSVDMEYRDVYEHWIVSEWLARKLEARGESVCHDLYGLTVWGRCTTGQDICLDGVIGDIAREMEILPGQANDWSKQSV